MTMALSCWLTWLIGMLKALIEGQEACQSAQCKAAHTVQRQDTAYDSTDHIADISQLGVDRAQNVGESICIVGAVKQLVVQLLETLLCSLPHGRIPLTTFWPSIISSI